jgi:hypothetical protein
MGGDATTDTDRGWIKISEAAEALAKSAVEVGIFGGIHNLLGQSIADYAIDNEFGAPKAHIPERSFVRATVDRNRGKYDKLVDQLIDDILEGRGTVQGGLVILGMMVQNDIKLFITNFRSPADAPATILKKLNRHDFKRFKKLGVLPIGANHPLIDTGAMRNAVLFRVIDTTGGGQEPAGEGA